MTPSELLELATKTGLSVEGIAKAANVKIDTVETWLKTGSIPVSVLEMLSTSIQQDVLRKREAAGEVQIVGKNPMPNGGFKFDTTIGLSDPRISDARIKEMLKNYGPDKPNDGVPYAALVFPSGKQFIAVGPNEQAIEELIRKYIATANFIALMTPLLHLEHLSGQSIHLPLEVDRLTYVVSSYGKWLPEAQTFSFSEALVSITQRDNYRPDLVNGDIGRFEKLLRAEVSQFLKR